MGAEISQFWMLVFLETVIAFAINWIVFQIKIELKASGFKITMLYGHTLDVIYYAISNFRKKEYRKLIWPGLYLLLVSLFVYIVIELFKW